MFEPKVPQLIRGNLINGEFRIPKDQSGQLKLVSPANFKDAIGTFSYSYSDVDTAVASARDAFRTWKKSTAKERADILTKYASLVKSKEDLFAEVISREVGKPLWESKTEVNAMVGKIGVTLQESLKDVEEKSIPNILPDTTGVCRYKPLGVAAVIGPFNFPGHLANGHIVPALATGNCVIFKPSEKTPLTGQLMAECFVEAGVPRGVFSLIQGEKEVGRRLVVHEGVDAVLFTGSYEVGTRIKQDTLQQHWKLLALEMGGKNSAIVCDDAELESALLETIVGAFLTAGQRCSATSRILVQKAILKSFVDRFHDRAKAFEIGHPFKNPFMGPLIDQSSVDRYQKFLGIAAREGFELVMRGKSLACEVEGHYVAPSICLRSSMTRDQVQKSVYQQTELFAPNVSIVGFEDLDEAIELANETQYGLVASIFTQDEKKYHYAFEELQTGLLNWNRSTVGASSRLPFGGLKKSGNHFPTALTATRYCTYPVSCLEVTQPKANPASYQGLHWA